ncbi:hypothetical protein M7I_5384 [Glarea lozoyensis 74030]|uniref:Uncharacterized protein n=1 Tax=Glarea lozoyensis (strain ATCC 74030 / MF5533) TaxID=1104152 RepID=H0ERR3_GLAL7|nr:hypothetical protein M7I_5384 [Glarea lozoyensis 74030]
MSCGNGLRLERRGQLDAPFVLHLRDAEEGGAEDADDERGEEREAGFPVVSKKRKSHTFRGRPFVFADGVEGADETGADYEAEEEAEECSVPDLGGVSFGFGMEEWTAWSADGPERVCLRNARSTEQITATSRVSRKTMKKTGTAKTSFAILGGGGVDKMG